MLFGDRMNKDTPQAFWANTQQRFPDYLRLPLGALAVQSPPFGSKAGLTLLALLMQMGAPPNWSCWQPIPGGQLVPGLTPQLRAGVSAEWSPECLYHCLHLNSQAIAT